MRPSAEAARANATPAACQRAASASNPAYFERRYQPLTGRLALNYELTPQWSTYVQYSTAADPPAGITIRAFHPGQPGDIAGWLVDRVLNGKAGTAMQAFKATLSDADLAAIITYERNAFGNNKGDMIQPAQIKALR